MTWATLLCKRLLRLLPLSFMPLLGGCNWVVLDPKGQIGLDERSIIATTTLLMLVVVVPVIVMVFAFAWKYRASNTRASFTPDWDSSHKIAAVVILLTCTIVLCLSVVSWKTTHKLDPFRPIASNAEPITIDVVALDWKWLFIYPDLNIATVNEIAFTSDVPVNFKITSASVMNSFFIPQLGGQIYAMPGMQTKLSLIASEPGTYDGMSANYSGGGFSDMKFKAIAMSQQGFDGWVAKVRQSSRRMGPDAYTVLAKPSERNPVEYFSSVDANLHRGILHQALNEAMPVCSASKE
jgi:cytochrome o ubiquinol oxidase subunit II